MKKSESALRTKEEKIDLIKQIRKMVKDKNITTQEACESFSLAKQNYYTWCSQYGFTNKRKTKVIVKTYEAPKPRIQVVKPKATASSIGNFFMVSGTPAQIAEFARSF